MYDIFTYANYFIVGYGLSTIAFLIITAFVKRFRVLRRSYLNVANLSAMFLALTVTLITIVTYYKNYPDAAENDLVLPAYRTQFFIRIFFTGVVPLLFLFKKLRQNIIITIVVIASINWFMIYEQVYIWMTHFYRDYVPSSWSVEYASPMLYFAVASIIYFSLVFTIASMMKSKELNNNLEK